MLNLFRSNRMIMGLLLIPYALLLRSYGFARRIPNDYDNGGLITHWLYEAIDLGGHKRTIVALVLVLLQAGLLVVLSNKHKLSDGDNLFPGIFFLIVASLSVSFLGLSPALIGNLFLLLALSEFFEIYKHKNPSGHHFNAGVWLALAALSYGSLSTFLIFGLLALNLLRAFNIKEVLQLVFGYFVPFFLVWVYFLFTGNVEEGYFHHLTNTVSIMDLGGIDDDLAIVDYVTTGLLAGIIMLVVASYGLYMEKQNIKNRKNVNLLFYFILCAGLSTLVQSRVGVEHFLLMAGPLGLLLGIRIAKMKSPFWSESWHLLLFAVGPVCHYLLG